jgi:hypothetical protein
MCAQSVANILERAYEQARPAARRAWRPVLSWGRRADQCLHSAQADVRFLRSMSEFDLG